LQQFQDSDREDNDDDEEEEASEDDDDIPDKDSDDDKKSAAQPRQRKIRRDDWIRNWPEIGFKHFKACGCVSLGVANFKSCLSAAF